MRKLVNVMKEMGKTVQNVVKPRVREARPLGALENPTRRDRAD